MLLLPRFILLLPEVEDHNKEFQLNFLDKIGVHIKDHALALVVHDIIVILIIIAVAFILYLFTRKFVAKIILKLIGKTKTHWDDILYNQHFFSKLSYLIPPFATHFGLSYINLNNDDLIRKLISIWIIIVFLLILNSLLNSINKIYESYPISKNRPITVFIQITKIFLYCVVGILIFSVVFGKKPANLILGLGAFAAVLMLIFKDSILGFVAGIQLIANDMVRIGDWIVMENNDANGTVLEINLYTVKVQNWDMTISTIPTYQLVSQSFVNWRGMEESHGRRIMRSINIDISSVHFLTKEEITNLRSSTLLSGYIDKMLTQLEDLNKDKTTIFDERKLTNIGVFRQYMDLWIDNNPDINTDMTHMVRQLQPTSAGMPIQIYCFSRIQDWVSYEKVQADIFDHIMAVIPQFNLRVLQFAIPENSNQA